MSDHTHNYTTNSTSGGSTGIGFIVGGLVVAVAVLAFFLFAPEQSNDDVTVTIEGAGAAAENLGNAVEGAADAVEGAAADATGN